MTLPNSFCVNPSIETWKELIEPTLLAVIQRNESLKQQFQTVKSHLNRLNNISLELLPTETELDQVAPKKKQPISFVLPDDSDDQKNYETTNMVILATSRILETPQPDVVVKKLSSLDKKRIFSAKS